MRLALRSTLILASLTASASVCAAPKDPSGTWLTEDGRAKIRVDRCGPGSANICGKVVWLRIPNWDDGTPRTDAKNPDPKKRSRPMIGLQLMSNLQAEEDGFAGEIYNADSGKIYQVTVERQSASELNVQGCVMKLLCGSQTWTKVPDVNQQAAAGTAAAKPAKPAAAAAKQPE